MARRIQKFREMEPNELRIQEKELAEQMFRLRFQLSTGQAEALRKLRETRRDLARVKTLLRQEAAPPPAAESAGPGKSAGAKRAAEARKA